MIAALVALALVAGAPVDPSGSKDGQDGKEGKATIVDVVDLNLASAVELCTLPGIGPKKAEAIMALRSKRAFTRVTQLLQVKGIGPKTLDRLKSRVRLGPVATTHPTSTPTPAAAALPPLAPLLPLPSARSGMPPA
ncbi:MAG: helix-hairpin-helix domain-containing protein [Deltaproteobacteria bacterium]|nr:helix-hairpin-helix domain-containing protein [Deltaproteobacteria bacterium]